MPNHCENYLEVEGPASDVRRFEEAIRDQVTDDVRIVNLMPMPEILEGTKSPSPKSEQFDEDGKYMEWVNNPTNENWNMDKYNKAKAIHAEEWAAGIEARETTGFSDWYSWAISDENWGTKWGDYETHLDSYYDDERGQIDGRFETAWSPLSNSFWEHVSKQFPTLKISVSFREEGMCFEGGQAYYAGECHYDETSELSAHHSSARGALANL